MKEVEKSMQMAIDHFMEELKGIRTGQANPAMVENIQVEVYGSHMRLRDIASITSPEMRQLLITPFDGSNTAKIAKGIERANIGFIPNVDGNVIRLNIPAMDDTLRKEMVKVCHKKREEAKVSIRNIRRDANELAKKQKNEGEIGEDILKKREKEIQELTDRFCKIADTLAAEKEKQVSSI